jgi:two-component system, chemotaxis family, chemotaxis protein CheY
MQADAQSQLQLPAVLDLAAAPGLLATLCQAQAPAALDASAVEVLSSACIQIIVAALAAQPLLGISNPSAAFVGAFADLALEWRAHVPAEPQTSAGVADATQTDAPIVVATETNGACMAKRILTIDDSRTIRDMLNMTLSEAGYEVLQAVDGQDGIDVFGKERVDLVITDINMPKMDGYEVIRHIRGKPEHKSMPVLVLTTESEAAKRNIAREAGATGWLVKPFDPERLIATINKVAP